MSINICTGYLLKEYLKSDIADLSHDYVPPFVFADLYGRLGDKDRAFENLEKTYKEGGHNNAFLKVEPGLDNLRSDPRFTDLLPAPEGTAAVRRIIPRRKDADPDIPVLQRPNTQSCNNRATKERSLIDRDCPDYSVVVPDKPQLRLRRVASARNLSRVPLFASVFPGFDSAS